MVGWRDGLWDGGEVVVEEVVGLAGLCEFVHGAEGSIGKLPVLGGFRTVASRQCGL